MLRTAAGIEVNGVLSLLKDAGIRSANRMKGSADMYSQWGADMAEVEATCCVRGDTDMQHLEH